MFLFVPGEKNTSEAKMCAIHQGVGITPLWDIWGESHEPQIHCLVMLQKSNAG